MSLIRAQDKNEKLFFAVVFIWMMGVLEKRRK